MSLKTQKYHSDKSDKILNKGINIIKLKNRLERSGFLIVFVTT